MPYDRCRICVPVISATLPRGLGLALDSLDEVIDVLVRPLVYLFPDELLCVCRRARVAPESADESLAEVGGASRNLAARISCKVRGGR